MCDINLLRFVLSLVLKLNGIKKGETSMVPKLTEDFLQLSQWAQKLLSERGDLGLPSGDNAGVQCLALLQEALCEAEKYGSPPQLEILRKSKSDLAHLVSGKAPIDESRKAAVQFVRGLRAAYPHLGIPELDS